MRSIRQCRTWAIISASNEVCSGTLAFKLGDVVRIDVQRERIHQREQSWSPQAPACVLTVHPMVFLFLVVLFVFASLVVVGSNICSQSEL